LNCFEHPSSFQELQATRILKGFATLVPSDCIVVRNGHPITITAAQLVVGDIVHLQTGSRVPSDIRVASSNGMKVDKSMLTGEAEPMRVTADPLAETTTYLEASNMLFMGSNIVEGSGVGVVVATGKDNLLSKIVQQASGVDAPTSLQVEVNRFITIICTIAGITAIVIIFYWIFWLRTTHPGFMVLASMLANVIGVVVAYVPEGFPLALSIGLTIIAKRLCGKYFVLAKRLGCIETLGSISMLCSDKTGTLTQNLMSVTMILSAVDVKLFQDGRKRVDPFENATRPGAISEEDVSLDLENITSLSCRVAALCNQAKMQREKPTDDLKKDVEAGPQDTPLVAMGSNSTDRAILNWANNNTSLSALSSMYEQRALMPFSSVTKLAASVVTHRTSLDTFVLVKGASEFLLPLCSSFLDAAGATQSMTDEFKEDLMTVLSVEADKGRRIIMLAQIGPLDAALFPSNFEYSVDPVANFPTDNLTFLSCVVVSDPPRLNVDTAIAELRTAGIIVAMVTGDSPSTAIAISSQIGIVTCAASKVDTLSTFVSKQRAMEANLDMDTTVTATSSAMVITGKDLETISPPAWDFVFAHRELVFARTSPEQKLQIVKEAQARGHRVGVTGDGVNDSPALKNADVGIAMNSGSDVARDVSDVVLLNDDFTAIVHGVREGRLIFENLRKAIAYLLSAGSWAEILPVFVTFFLGMPQPLSAFLMIIICCLTDMYAGVALMNEPPEGGLLSLHVNILMTNLFADRSHHEAATSRPEAHPSDGPEDDLLQLLVLRPHAVDWSVLQLLRLHGGQRRHPDPAHTAPRFVLDLLTHLYAFGSFSTRLQSIGLATRTYFLSVTARVNCCSPGSGGCSPTSPWARTRSPRRTLGRRFSS
jgi:sodium/potassium-transporting ATPase subunit alpha